MLLKDLQKLGFTKNLAIVYTTLFDLGEAKAGNIVRSTGIHRNLVYLALEELEEKKLVSKSQTRGVARFNVLDPSRLLGEVEEKKKLAEDIIDELKSKHKVQSQEIVIYEGLAEMQKKMTNVYESMEIGENMDILGGTSSRWFEIMGEKNINKFLEIQKNSKFFINLVVGKIDENEQRLKKELGGLINYKIIPNISSKTTETIILKDRIIVLIFVEPYTTVEIINPAVVESYREYFDLLWNQEVVVETGIEALEKVFFRMLEELDKDDKYYVLGATMGPSAENTRDFFDKFHKKRIDKGVVVEMLVSAESFDELTDRFFRLGDSKYDISFLKKFPSNSPQPFQINLYKEKADIIIYGEDVTVIHLDKPEIYRGFKNYFDYLWNQEVQTYSGKEEVLDLFNKIILEKLNEDDYEYVIGEGYGEKNMDDYVTKLFREHNSYLIKNKIHKHVLMYEKYRKKFENEVKEAGDKKFEYVHIRYLPDIYSFPVETHVYKDMAVITYFGENPVSTLYTHPKIIENYKKQFDLLWGIAKE